MCMHELTHLLTYSITYLLTCVLAFLNHRAVARWFGDCARYSPRLLPHPSTEFRSSPVPATQVPEGLACGLAPAMHLVDVATSMQLKSTGQGEKCVPFVYQKKQKMTVYKGPDALATRRAVAKALTPSLITALQRPRRADDKPNWAPMQQLYDAGLSYDLYVSQYPSFSTFVTDITYVTDVNLSRDLQLGRFW